jgi:hypothetical protein
MTTGPVRIDRPLTELEKTIITYLAIRTVADQSGASEDDAAAALDTFTEDGLVHLRGNAYDVCLDADGTLRVGRERMAESTGIPARTLDRHLRDAVALGWLMRERRGQKGVVAVYRAAVPDTTQHATQHATSGVLNTLSARHSRGVLKPAFSTPPGRVPR